MKFIIGLLILLSAQVSLATTYKCQDSVSGEISTLEISVTGILWKEFSSGDSEGIFIGIEESDSDWKSFYKYHLYQLESSSETQWNLTVSPELFYSESSGEIYQFNDDGQNPVAISRYRCQL